VDEYPTDRPVKTTVNLPADAVAALRALARDRARTTADVIRRAIWLEKILHDAPQTLTESDFGEIVFQDGDEIPSAELLISRLNIPASHASTLAQVQYLPLTILQAIAKDPRLLHGLTPRQFEEFTAELLAQLGFTDVLLTPTTGDGGRDVIARRIIADIPITFFFECKKHAEGNAVQLDTLRSLLGVVAHRANEANIGVLVTTSHFTRGCRDLIASECRLDGKDYAGITNWLNTLRRR